MQCYSVRLSALMPPSWDTTWLLKTWPRWLPRPTGGLKRAQRELLVGTVAWVGNLKAAQGSGSWSHGAEGGRICRQGSRPLETQNQTLFTTPGAIDVHYRVKLQEY